MDFWQACKKARLTTAATTSSAVQLPPPSLQLPPPSLQRPLPAVQRPPPSVQLPPPAVVLPPETIATTSSPAELPPPAFVLSAEPVEEEEEEKEKEDSDGSEEEEKSDDRESEDEEEEEQKGNTLTLTDPDVLDCPICYEPLTIPVYQCTNGHIACTSCCRLIKNKCPTCSRQIKVIRCRAIEKVLEAVQVSCENRKYGCNHVIKYCEDRKRTHASSCIYSPCSCPMNDCNFVASSSKLYEHIHTKHSTTNFRFNSRFSVFLNSKIKTRIFLREETEGIVFVLNIIIEDGVVSVLSVVLIAPKSQTGLKKYRYELEAKDDDTSVTLKSHVETVSKLPEKFEPTKYVIVEFINQSPWKKLELDICIRDHGKNVDEGS